MLLVVGYGWPNQRDIVRTSYGHRTGVKGTYHGHTTDIRRDIVRTSYGRRIDTVRTSYGHRRDIVRTSYGHRTDIPSGHTKRPPLGDAAGVWNFFVAFRAALWNFPRRDRESKEFRGFPGMELGIFRVAKSSGEGREHDRELPNPGILPGSECL